MFAISEEGSNITAMRLGCSHDMLALGVRTA